MLGTHNLLLFVVSGILLNITPGPDSLYIAGRSIAQDRRAGVTAALGIGASTFVHIFAAALGLSAIIMTSATAFMIVKLVGTAYLIYIGISLLCIGTLEATSPMERSTPLPLKKIFMQGFLTNTLNPKVALFFLAFVPQFIEPNANNVVLAFLFLGGIFNFTSMLWCLFLACMTATAGSDLALGRWLAVWINRAVGVVIICLGVKLATGIGEVSVS